MKRIIYKSSIIIPLAMIFYSFIEPFAFCVPEIGLYMETYSSRILIVMVTVVWLCCSPFRRGTCNGTITELLFNLVPVEFVLMLVFAQHHFVITLLITLTVAGGEIALFRALKKDEQKHRFSRKRHRRYQFTFRRCSILGIAVFCAVPCLLSIFVYGVESPTYKSTEELWEQLFLEPEVVESDKPDNLYEKKSELWGYLEKENWSRLSVQERITVTQELVDFESDVLGIPTVPVTSVMIGTATLGAYDNELNQMWINTEHLANSSVCDVINTICHEVHHSYVDYLVNTLDWDNPAMNSAYFAELRELMDSQENYKSAWSYGFDAYENQPLEVAAREYSEKETAIIMTYIEGSG
ncbi:MAG: hypothetical protein IKK09_03540 [Clostridia bacterium]|nr:hypothetical protein [Clostridia bacterium]